MVDGKRTLRKRPSGMQEVVCCPGELASSSLLLSSPTSLLPLSSSPPPAAATREHPVPSGLSCVKAPRVALLLLLLSMLSLHAHAHKLCNGVALVDCKRRYERCKLFDGPSQDKELTLCMCAKLYYGSCLRDAGCASDHMVECIDDMLRNECTDMTVCGNNCASAHEVPEDAIIIPVNNYGENYLRFGYCNSTALDETYLAKYGTVRIEKCVAGAFTFCPYWIPPKTFTSLAIPQSAEFLQLYYCQYTEVSGNITHTSCLDHYDEVYGQPKLWPSSIDIEFAHAYRCERDDDCPGSFCDFHFTPPLCSPKWQMRWRGYTRGGALGLVITAASLLSEAWGFLVAPARPEGPATIRYAGDRHGIVDRQSFVGGLAGAGVAALLGQSLLPILPTRAIGLLPEFEADARFAQHLVVRVPDMEAALKFYIEGLSMQILRTRVSDDGINTTFVGYGAETLRPNRTDFLPGVSSFSEAGGHFSLELVEVKSTASQDEQAIVDPGNGVAYLHMGVPNARISKIIQAGGEIVSAYGYIRVLSPGGLLHQVIVGERRDPFMFLALNVQDLKRSVAFYKDAMGMREQEYPLSRKKGSAYEPTQPKGTVYISYNPDGFGILLIPTEKKRPVRVGGVVDRLAIADTGVLDAAKAEAIGATYAGRAPSGTRIALGSDPDGYGIVLVEYEDLERELPDKARGR